MIKFSKTNPSFLTVKEGSTFLTKPLFPQGREDVTALRCSEPLRYKVGGPIKGLAILCGMGPPYYSLLIGTARIAPHCSIALRLSSLEWGIFRIVTASVYGMTACPMFKLQHISSYATFIGLKYSTTQQEYKRVKKNS